MTIHCGIGARRRRDGGGDEVARVVFKGRGSGGGVSTRVSSLCSILRAVGFSLWKAQRACLFVARKLSFTIWAILHASLLQMEKKSFLSSWTMGQVHVFILNSKTGYMRCSDSRYRTYDLASSDVQTFYDFGCLIFFTLDVQTCTGGRSAPGCADPPPAKLWSWTEGVDSPAYIF